MTIPAEPPPPRASALQDFLHTHALPTTTSSSTSSSSPHRAHLHNLALQIAHNLRYQHLWTDVTLHTHTHSSSRSTPADTARQDNSNATSASHHQHQPTLLPRPLISGTPPSRLYIHPDEQMALLRELKKGEKEEILPDLAHLAPQREWVLPTHLREKWSLGRFGKVFDAISRVPPLPPAAEGGVGVGVRVGVGVEGGGGGGGQKRLFEAEGGETIQGNSGGARGGEKGDSQEEEEEEEEEEKDDDWRGKLPKRLLLATLDDDSTVVYYIVHDGVVKPRQN